MSEYRNKSQFFSNREPEGVSSSFAHENVLKPIAKLEQVLVRTEAVSVRQDPNIQKAQREIRQCFNDINAAVFQNEDTLIPKNF